MEGTDVNTGKSDTDRRHDHTYYGNGCSNVWSNDPPLYGGSTKSCSSHMTGTVEGEPQAIGTYYHYFAATSGSADYTGTDDVYAPDSFCPLGWQLPYSGTGGDYHDKSRSWRYLFGLYNISDNPSGGQAARSYPFSYVKAGYYYWAIGILYGQNVNSRFWSNTNSGGTGFRLNANDSQLQMFGGDSVTVGGTIRCTLGISNLKALHGIRVRL